MQDFTTSVLCLKSVLSEHRSYHDVLSRALTHEKLSLGGKDALRKTLWCALRHYQTLSFEAMNLFAEDENSSDERYLTLVALTQFRYLKGKNPEVFEAYRATFAELSLQGDAAKRFAIISKAAQKPFVIPESLKSAPSLYNSLSLEIPEFLWKKLSEFYGPAQAASIALSLHFPPTFFVAPDATARTEVFSAKTYIPVQVKDQYPLYRLQGIANPFGLPEIQDHRLCFVPYVFAAAVNAVPLPQNSPRLLITGNISSDPCSYLARRIHDCYDPEVMALFEDSLRFRLASDAKERLSLDDLTLQNEPLPLLKTYVAFDSFDVVFCFGKDSGIGMARKVPSVLPSLTEKEIVSSGKKTLAGLLETSEFVKKEGTLVFVSGSLLKEETRDIVARFLTLRKNFTLAQDLLLLPFENNSDGGYFAVLKRGKK
jgi:hypothetical protein